MDVLVTLTGDREVAAKYTEAANGLAAAIQLKMTTLVLQLEAKVKTEKLDGQVLNRRTGALARSISHKVSVAGDTITGTVFSSGDVKYAAIHEFGGQTAPHEIVANKAKALAFAMGGKTVFAKRVMHPGSKIPERSFLRSSLSEMAGQIAAGLKQAAFDGVAKA